MRTSYCYFLSLLLFEMLKNVCVQSFSEAIVQIKKINESHTALISLSNVSLIMTVILQFRMYKNKRRIVAVDIFLAQVITRVYIKFSIYCVRSKRSRSWN